MFGSVDVLANAVEEHIVLWCIEKVVQLTGLVHDDKKFIIVPRYLHQILNCVNWTLILGNSYDREEITAE